MNAFTQWQTAGLEHPVPSTYSPDRLMPLAGGSPRRSVVDLLKAGAERN